MADFTINSLAQATPNASDMFLKSDSEGVLTKVPFSVLASEITNSEVHTITVQSAGSVKMRIAAFKNIIVATMLSDESTLLTGQANTWVTFAETPSDIGWFNVLSLPINNGLIKIRSVTENGRAVLQYNSTVTSTNTTTPSYISASGTTLKVS